jgi:hypothetical protein
MSETVTADAPAPDPSDPAAAAAAIRAEREASERAYRAAVDRERNRATVAEQRVEALTQDRATLEFSTIANGLDAVEQRRDLIGSQIQAAMEAGDGAKLASLTAQMGEVMADFVKLRDAKQQMEARRNQQLAQPPPTAPQRDPVMDGGESELAKIHPASAAWIRAQRDANGGIRYFTDPVFRERVTRAHFHAIGEEKQEFSPEYYAHIESRIGMKPANAEEPRPARPSAAQEPEGGRSDPPRAAPVRNAASYSDNSQRGGGDNHVPADVIDTCVRMFRFVDGKGKPDMARIGEYWRESRRMARGGEFLRGEDPWSGVR